MDEESRKRARIVVVDDQLPHLELLTELLRHGGYANVYAAADPRTALRLVHETEPDLIVLDLMMPHVDGYTFLEVLRMTPDTAAATPVLVLTADNTLDTRRHALNAGARDFVNKPFDAAEMLLRIRNLLEVRFEHLSIQRQNALLKTRLEEGQSALDHEHTESLERLARIAEYRDDKTGEHLQRVGSLAGALARAIGLSATDAALLERAAPLHDIGKIVIPDHVLLKPEVLAPAEMEIMKTHTTVGAKILSGSSSPVLNSGEVIALTHHERWDGAGYPRGLIGAEIPLAGRVVAVVDAFDAMTHDRPYRPAYSPADAWQILWAGAGTQWEESLIEAFSKMLGPAAAPTRS